MDHTQSSVILINSDENTKITLSAIGVVILFNENSNLIILYLILKYSSNYNSFIPYAIFSIIIDDNGVINKNKKSLSFFSRMSLDEFRDSWFASSHDILYGSGEEKEELVNGWEVRFKIELSAGDFEGFMMGLNNYINENHRSESFWHRNIRGEL